jgi:N-acetylmuramic acid 6-phosphate etherase
MSDTANLLTEQRNPATENLDLLSTQALIETIHAEDAAVHQAVGRELSKIALVVDRIAERLSAGGRLFYSGAGTSGRLGVLDASECPPTYNVDPSLVQGIIAGGNYALRHAVEGAEDRAEVGAADLKSHGFTEKDVLIGIAASGRTPYVLGAIEYARALGALTIALSCVPHSRIAAAAEMEISPVTGPEVVSGSTRMKAGTATKLVLNMLSTATMVRLGYVYGNLMVNVRATNQKLRDRAQRIVMQATGITAEHATQLLKEAGSVKIAILMQQRGIDRNAAELCLQKAQGNLRVALGSAQI